MSPTSCHCSTPRRVSVRGSPDSRLSSPTRLLFLWMARGPTLPAGIPLVPSALQRFTTRFGMDRGGSTALRARHWLRACTALQLHLHRRLHTMCSCKEALAHAHLSPTRLTTLPVQAALPVISWGAYQPYAVSTFILGDISHLDAFSGSCSRT